MARGIAIQHVRKAGPFNGGELFAGELGLDVSAGVFYFSRNGTTVEQLPTGPGNAGAAALNDLSDVVLASLVEGNVLSYDATAGVWINRTLLQAGAIPTAQKGANNGVATLGSDGKIPSSQIPALAVSEVFVVASLTARNALTVQSGDVAIVNSAPPESYIYDGAQWQEFKTTDTAVDAQYIVSGNVASARMSANVGAALNASPAVTINNAALIFDAGSI